MPADETPTAPTPTGEHAVRVRCPHCGNRIQLVAPDHREVVCQSCGSSFHVDPDTTHSLAVERTPKRIGRFVLLARLGRGAFGTVYKARDPDLDRTVAVKVPRAGFFATADEEARFLREAKAAARLQHPGIVSVFEVADGDPTAIVSEYIDGVTLADRLTGGRPTFRESAELLAALADALDYAHRSGVVHRDVKPSNVLLDAGGKPHLTDFGLARRDEAEITVTLDGQVLGTPAYMSPEQAAGKAAVDGRADVYSLGVMLYEMLAGELPFRGNARMLLHQVLHDDPTPPRKRNDHIPRDLETVCLKALAKAPAGRYATAGELAADLRRWLAGQPVLARPVGRIERGWRWAMRNKTVAGLMGTAAVFLMTAVGVSVGFALFYHDATMKKEELLRQAERREGELAVEKCMLLFDRGEGKEGLLWAAWALERLERHDADPSLRRYLRLQLSLWGQHLTPNRIELEARCTPYTAQLLPDGASFLAVVDGDVARFDARSGKLLCRYVGHPQGGENQDIGVEDIHVSADGRRFVAFGELPRGNKDAAGRRFAWLWDVDGVRPVSKLELLQEKGRERQRATLPVWNSTLTRVLSQNKSGAWSVLRDVESGRTVLTVPAAQTGGVPGEMSADGSTLLTYGEDAAHCWDTLNGAKLGSIPLGERPKANQREIPQEAHLSPDGRFVFTSPREEPNKPADRLRIPRFDARSGKPLPPLVMPPMKNVEFEGFRTSDDGQWLLTVFTDVSDWSGDHPSKIAAWKYADATPRERSDLHPDVVSTAGAFGLNTEMRVVNLATGKVTIRFPTGHEFAGFGGGGAVGLSFDRGLYHLWDTASSRKLGPDLESGPGSFLGVGQFHGVEGLTRFRRDDFLSGMHPPSTAIVRYGVDTEVLLDRRVFAPVEAMPERITLWAQVVTGMELDDSGTPRPLDQSTLAERKRTLDALGGSPLPKP